MPTSAASVFDELPRHAAFLRALARGILDDEHLSEDVVQQVFVQALLDPPSERGALRAWLTRVTRRLALNAVAMLNYLAVEDIESAAVEARRFTVAREYLEGLELPAPGSAASCLYWTW